MPRRDPIADAMSHLSALRANPSAPEALQAIEKALASKANILVARAAQMVHDGKLRQFEKALVAAFDRFMVDSSSTDKGCAAKTAIARALYETEARVESLFLTGIHHTQPEGVWGGNSDSAAELRGLCALGLVRCNYRDVMIELGDLLMDPQTSCRIMAARAIAYAENDAGIPLLRMKVLGGDREFEVISECFIALLQLSPRKNVEFVARYMDDEDDDVMQSAILALGESRLPAAFNALTEQYHRQIDGMKRAPLILAIALSRLPASIDFLMGVIAQENKMLALAAIDALKIYRADTTIKARLSELIKTRGDQDLRRVFEIEWK